MNKNIFDKIKSLPFPIGNKIILEGLIIDRNFNGWTNIHYELFNGIIYLTNKENNHNFIDFYTDYYFVDRIPNLISS